MHKNFLRQSVEDRKLMIRLRKEVYEQNMSEIASEREVKERRLRHLAMAYGAERTTLMNHISKLGSGARKEARGS